jgi:hypothetical protein
MTLLRHPLILQRQLGGNRGIILSECLEDLLPNARVAPAVIAAVDRLPGTEMRRQFAPGGSRPRDPEHAGEDGAMVVGRTTRARLLRWEQGSDASPTRISERRDGRSEDLDRERAARSRMVLCPACRVTAAGNRLVPATKDRPGELEAAAFRGFGERQQQAADFRHSERDQAGRPPFCSALAWSRVTSR